MKVISIIETATTDFPGSLRWSAIFFAASFLAGQEYFSNTQTTVPFIKILESAGRLEVQASAPSIVQHDLLGLFCDLIR